MACSIVPGSKLRHPNRTLQEIRDLDDQVYGDLRERDNPKLAYWKKLHAIHPDQVVWLLDEKGRGVGNLHLIPLLREQFDAVLAGKFTDPMVTEYSLRCALQMERRLLHLTSFLIAPKHRGHGHAREMWNHAAGIWRNVGEICAVSWMPTASRFLGPLPWHVIPARDMDGHRIYRMTIDGGKLPIWEDGVTRATHALPKTELRPLQFGRE